eukprot:6378968-Amphidinium_carterae.1
MGVGLRRCGIVEGPRSPGSQSLGVWNSKASFLTNRAHFCTVRAESLTYDMQKAFKFGRNC